MRVLKGTLCVLLLIISAIGNVELTVENKGYDVLISFSQNVPPTDGLALVESMKANLEDASETLHNATGLRFSKVTFNIPPSWDTSDWVNFIIEDTSSFSKSKADILIDNTNDVAFGKFPHAQQYGSCGVPGHQIIIPSGFFHESNTFPRGKTLAREWLKYRFGVFDENGYFGDSMYPEYYIIPGGDEQDVRVTDCTNQPVTYDFLGDNSTSCSDLGGSLIDHLNSRKCDITPYKESLENVVSSIMYHHKDILSLEHICGNDPDHQHNFRSPNKHNALCFGQSIWDVMNKSSDFVYTAIEESDSNAIEYTYVRQSPLKIVVTWEDTPQLRTKGTDITNALKKFVIDLPDGSQFDGFPFKDSLKPRDYKLKVLNGLEDKKNIQEHLSSDFVGTQKGNTTLAISKALDILSDQEESLPKSEAKAEGTIIILTTNGTVEENVLQRLKSSDVCITIALFTNSESEEPPAVDVSELPCATLERLKLDDDNAKEKTFEKLFNAMETLLPTVVNDQEIKTVDTQYLTGESIIKLEVDDTIANVTFWVFDKKRSENFDLTFNDEKKDIVEEIIRDVSALSFSPTEAGTITFKYPHADIPPFLIQVRTTSKPGQYFSGDVVTYDTSGDDPSQMPVLIYTFIRYGAYPVQNAKVSATIQRPEGENVELQLIDDGKGDPDITHNDGIYSRYFTKFSGQGEYTVTITVTNNEENTIIGNDQDAGYKTCCGSFVTGGASATPPFSKVFKTSFTTTKDPPTDGYKPSRIVDLKIDAIDDSKVVLKWTAPGGEADEGKAQSYEIKHFSSGEDVLNNFDSSTDVLDNASKDPQERGEIETFEINFGDLPQGHRYIAMKATNPNKTSDLSNIIAIFTPEDETTPTPKPKDTKKATTNKTIGIVIGVIAAVIVLAIVAYAVVYSVVLKPKRKKEKKEIENREREERERKRAAVSAARDNNAMNPISYVPASTIMEHHNEKTKAKLEFKEPPVFKEEDFEDRKSAPSADETGEGSGGSNNQPLTSRDSQNTGLKNNGALPPKSPKRTTPV